MAYSESDKRFAARCCGTSIERVRRQLRDPSELGYVQLVAAAVPLVTGFMKKKKAKKRRKREEALARAQAAAAPATNVAAASLAPTAAPAASPAPAQSNMARMAVPLAIAGGVLVLALALRR